LLLIQCQECIVDDDGRRIILDVPFDLAVAQTPHHVSPVAQS